MLVGFWARWQKNSFGLKNPTLRSSLSPRLRLISWKTPDIQIIYEPEIQTEMNKINAWDGRIEIKIRPNRVERSMPLAGFIQRTRSPDLKVRWRSRSQFQKWKWDEDHILQPSPGVVFNPFSAGTVSIRQNLTSVDGPRSKNFFFQLQ